LSRGDRREDIVFDDEDRKRFVETLGEAATRANWQVHAFCLMRNHFHLVIETPQPTLVRGMQWMLGTYTARFNARHRLCGHLFSGRYKSIVVDEAQDGYLRRVCDYTHLNPVRAKIVGEQDALESYAWSSYPLYLWPARKQPKWLRVDRVLGEHGIPRNGARGRREFSGRMETLRSQDDEEFRRLLRRGWRLGPRDFLERLEQRMTGPLSDNHDPEQVAETMQARVARLLAQELKRCKITPEELCRLPKSHPLKIRFAEKLHRETPMTLRWIATALYMGSWHYVSHLLYLQRRKKHINKV
jgi:putative transposase